MTVHAFVDESGDPNLDVARAGHTHYAIGAVVVPQQELTGRRAAVDEVRRKHFGTGAIKSKTVGSNLARRLSILRSLADAGVRGLGLAIDKRAIRPDSGLQYRRPFVKFVGRFMFDRLFRAYPMLRISADTVGRPDFMDSFKEYLRAHWAQIDLFNPRPPIDFVQATDETLVQAADFLAGSIRIAFDGKTSEDDARGILSGLRPMLLSTVHEWPLTPRAAATVPTASAPGVDDLIRSAAERSVYTFLNDAKAEGEDDRLRVEVLQELAHAARFEEQPFISAEALAARMQARGFADCSRDRIRRSVVAPLRDRDVLVVSSAKGYGLPSGLADVETHLHRMEEEVRPILRRVQSM